MTTLLAQHHRMRARLERSFAPKGPEQTSPGQRPGNAATRRDSVAPRAEP